MDWVFRNTKGDVCARIRLDVPLRGFGKWGQDDAGYLSETLFLLVSPGDAGPLYWLLMTSVAYSVNERGIVIGDYNVLWVVVYERLK